MPLSLKLLTVLLSCQTTCISLSIFSSRLVTPRFYSLKLLYTCLVLVEVEVLVEEDVLSLIKYQLLSLSLSISFSFFFIKYHLMMQHYHTCACPRAAAGCSTQCCVVREWERAHCEYCDRLDTCEIWFVFYFRVWDIAVLLLTCSSKSPCEGQQRVWRWSAHQQSEIEREINEKGATRFPLFVPLSSVAMNKEQLAIIFQRGSISLS